jgi:hypothetical protein
MSDVSQGTGWWQASDGKWYAPQQAQVAAPPPPVHPAAADMTPKKKFYKRVWFWLLVVVAVGIGGCISLVSVASVAVDKANTTKHTIVYSVTGDGQADITYNTYTNGNSGTQQATGQNLPWKATITESGLFNLYSVGGTLTSGSSVTCSITVDGKVLSTHSSTGQFASADCTASSS